MTRIILIAALVATAACKKQPPEVAVAPVAEIAPAPAPAPLTIEEAITRMALNFERVHFAFDSSTLDAVSKAALEANVKIMQQHPKLSVEVQGHADERGTTDYNVALGDRRAHAVRDQMMLMGVSKSRVDVVSFGEEVPLDRTGGEDAWSKNRRAEFRIMVGEDGVAGTVK